MHKGILITVQKTTTLNTSQQIPLIGFGTWRMGEATYDSVLAALRAGYRHIDTAMIYNNEEAVGKAIADSKIPREELFITTKLWNNDHDDVDGAFNLSLDKLGLEYIDLYLIHWPLPTRVAAYKKMEQLLESGQVKAIGVSNFTLKHLEDFLPQISVTPAVNQVEFNPFLNQHKLLEYCQLKGIVLEAYSPLTHAHKLSDPKLIAMAKKYGISPAQTMLKWSIQQGIVVLPKSQSESRINENLAVFNFEISENDISEINTWNEDARFCGDPTKMP